MLSKHVDLYECPKCECISEYKDMEGDEYSSSLRCPMCGKWSNDYTITQREATWWSVAVYEEGQQYGGPEEGGWWYRCGELVVPNKIRVFEEYEQAEAYLTAMWTMCEETNALSRGSDYRWIALGYTESLPDTYYPKKRPYYS